MEVTAFITKCDEFFNSFASAGPRTRNGYENVYDQARAQISEASQVLATITYLKHKLAILHRQKGLDYTKYTPVLSCIRESARRDLLPEVTTLPETDWDRLISLIIENRGELFYFEHEKSLHLEPRHHTFAYSYIRLKSIGVEFTEINNKIYISDRSNDLINAEINRLCRAYGGENLLNSLASRLGRTYNANTGRFMEYRRVSFGESEIQPAMPFGYLISIASKYVGSHGSANPEHFDRLLMLVADIIVIYEIQPYSPWEAMNIREQYIIEFITNNILYDNLVGIVQTKASYASSIIKHFQSRFDSQKYMSFGVKIKDLTKVARALISKSHTKTFSTVSANDIAQKAGVPKFKVLKAMDLILSASGEVVNSNLRFPPKSMDIDHYFKPAIKIGENYKIFPKSIASIGCVNAVCNSISCPNGAWSNSIDGELGYAIEDFVRDAFKNKGIKIVHGCRINGTPDLEVDLLCETEENIYIFEMKKKGLTRQAQSGDAGKILVDLADSVIATHLQAMRIENALKNNQHLDLVSDGVKQSVYLNGRSVRRVSVSFFDFGALQDKTVLQRLLNIAIRTNINHSDSTEDKKLNNWRMNSGRLRELACANGELSEGGIPFHNSLFMSIPQIFMLLELSSNADEFFKHILRFIVITTSSRDPYAEFLNQLSLLDRCKAEGLSI